MEYSLDVKECINIIDECCVSVVIITIVDVFKNKIIFYFNKNCSDWNIKYSSTLYRNKKIYWK